MDLICKPVSVNLRLSHATSTFVSFLISFLSLPLPLVVSLSLSSLYLSFSHSPLSSHLSPLSLIFISSLCDCVSHVLVFAASLSLTVSVSFSLSLPVSLFPLSLPVSLLFLLYPLSLSPLSLSLPILSSITPPCLFLLICPLTTLDTPIIINPFKLQLVYFRHDMSC